MPNMHPLTLKLGTIITQMRGKALAHIEDRITNAGDGEDDGAFEVTARLPIPDVGTLVLRLSLDLED